MDKQQEEKLIKQMKVVSNSGPLINLAKVDQFALLQDLFQHITVPPEVFEEVVVRGVGQPWGRRDLHSPMDHTRSSQGNMDCSGGITQRC